MKTLLTTILLFVFVNILVAQDNHSIKIHLSSADDGQPIVLANCVLQPLMTVGVTDAEGNATLKAIPKGEYRIEISYVGYEKLWRRVSVEADMQLELRLTPTTLSIAEVNVTAQRNSAGQGTSSTIGRQAIDHIQAASLADVMQLIPGQVIENTDLTGQKNIQIRQLVNDNTSAIGASIVVDGVAMSNNAEVKAGQFSATEFVGTDLRQMSADDIEKVEVVRGVPSAEYGDLTSGLVIVKTKIGLSPLNLKAKVNPQMLNVSASKGFKLGKKGILNFFTDYAQAYSDPRYKTRSFHRATVQTNYSQKFGKMKSETRLRFSYCRDWNGNDPDAISDGTKSESRDIRVSLSETVHISLDKTFARDLSFTASFAASPRLSEISSYVAAPSGLVAIITAKETGYYSVPFETSSYLATGKTESRPYNLFFKMSDTFRLGGGDLSERFNIGMDYHLDWNTGKGYYNVDERHPLRPNSDGRPRAFDDIPTLHQMAIYAEDNLYWKSTERLAFRLQAGMRLTLMQPWEDIRTIAVSPRVNLHCDLGKWLNLHAAIGLNSKTPTLSLLYPDKKYNDRIAVNYMPQDNDAGKLLAYHTYVYNVEYSKGLKNATNTKIEAGFGLKLPNDRTIDMTAYVDKTPNGFGAKTEYVTYEADYFTMSSGLLTKDNGETTIDYSAPARRDIVFTTTGAVGNTSVSENMGVELESNLGKISVLRTSITASAAWQQTKTWSKNTNSSNPVDNPTEYSSVSTTPFKIVYPSATDYSQYRRCVITIRTVTHIPELRIVASLAGQIIAHNSSLSYVAPKRAIGWITPDLVYHEITDDMQEGYIGTDGIYYATKDDDIAMISIANQAVSPKDNQTIEQPTTWQISGRLTKEFGRRGAFSFYANNLLFYEPFRTTSASGTLSQRNTGSFAFGAELSIKL